MTRREAKAILLCLGWPALASISLAMAVGRGTPDLQGILLLACSTASAYGLDRWIDHRPQESKTFRKGLLIAMGFCILAGGALALTSWWRFRICVLLGVISAAYVPLKTYIPINLLTATAWTVGACTLPFTEAPRMHPAYWSTVGCVFAIMVCDTVLCDMPDVEDDRKHGVRGITPRFGSTAGGILVIGFSLLGMILSWHSDHLSLGVTSAVFLPLSILLIRNPNRRWVPNWGDRLVTFLPGPLSLFLA